MNRIEHEIHAAVAEERQRQLEKWSAAHDAGHLDWEWLGLIASYVARARFVEAAALCEAAAEARGVYEAIR